ncbi:AAA family ATPase [Saliphagus sp. GCM10025308]
MRSHEPHRSAKAKPPPSHSLIESEMSERKRLVVVCGLPGTGKTTVASDLAARLEADLVRTDVVRKDRFPDPEYTETETQTTYEATLARAARALERDGVAVVDGTFRREPLRERARAVAEDADARFELVRVECDTSVVRTRIAEREGDESDADFAVYELLESEFEPPAEPHHRVDNSGSLAETRRQLTAICETLEARVS